MQPTTARQLAIASFQDAYRRSLALAIFMSLGTIWQAFEWDPAGKRPTQAPPRLVEGVGRE